MDRQQRAAELTKRSLPGLALDIASGVVEDSARDTAHSLFIPLKYEPRYDYPLIVWLHGAQATERQLPEIMPHVSLRNYVAIAPHGTLVACGNASPVYSWGQADHHVQQAEQRVFDCIEIARRRTNLSDTRIFLAGFDSGGSMAFRVAMAHPGRFAGVLSLCGAFPAGRKLLGNLHQARRLPVFLAIGRKSAKYPPAAACRDLRLFHSAGMCVTLREYPCGQDLDPRMLRDANRWIADVVTGKSA